LFWKGLRKILIRRFILFLVLIVLLGCGGGGGGSDVGTGIDPIEVEVGAALDSFLKAVNDKHLTEAMSWIDSNIQYRRANSTAIYTYNGFKSFLSDFLAKAASVSVQLRNRGIVPDGENNATIRGSLVWECRDASGTFETKTENCEIAFERVSKWGIRSLSGFNLEGLYFPPSL